MPQSIWNNKASTPRMWIALLGLMTAAVAVSAQALPRPATSPTSLQWGACPPPPSGIPASGMQCTTVSVPLDYYNPTGTQINIAISRIAAADPSSRRGVLLVNPGGPGGPGLNLPQTLAVLLPQSVLNLYDLIGFDPRGIGLSTPVTCGLTAQQSARAFPQLEEPGGFSATASFAQAVANGCSANASRMLPYMTTANTARDLDEIRQALSEQTISYLGYSYGTYLGAVYASLFPDQTDRFILDSSIAPQWVWQQVFDQWGPAGAVRFPDYENYAAANDATYHLGTTPAAIQAEYFQLLNSLYAKPMIFPDGTVFDGSAFREITFLALYDDADFAPISAIWSALKENPGNTAAVYAVYSQVFPPTAPTPGIPVDNLSASALAISCGDVAWSRSIAEYQSLFTTDSTAFPLFGAVGSNIWACAYWPNQPIAPLVTLTSSGPQNLLMLQDERDPAAPYWGALGMRAELGQRARLVSVDQGGHGVYVLKPNQCANDMGTNFLVNGTFPGADTYCPAETTSPEAASTSNSTQKRAANEMLRRLQRLENP